MRNKFSNNLAEAANAFTKAEKNLQLTGPGVGGYDLDHSSVRPLGGKMQTPAQHASVKKAAAVSVAKRQAGKVLQPRAAKKSLFGF
jgi:hypothetical protein